MISQTTLPLVDTDVWIDYLRGVPLAVAFVSALPERVAISAISVAELHVGVRGDKKADPEQVALDALLSSLEVIALSDDMARSGGILRRDYGRSHGVGLNDALIAATAQALGAVLYTLNMKHFPSLSAGQLQQAYQK